MHFCFLTISEIRLSCPEIHLIFSTVDLMFSARMSSLKYLQLNTTEIKITLKYTDFTLPEINSRFSVMHLIFPEVHTCKWLFRNTIYIFCKRIWQSLKCLWHFLKYKYWKMTMTIVPDCLKSQWRFKKVIDAFWNGFDSFQKKLELMVGLLVMVQTVSEKFF